MSDELKLAIAEHAKTIAEETLTNELEVDGVLVYSVSDPDTAEANRLKLIEELTLL